MDIQNHYYGHSAVLAQYCGLKKIHHIPGLLQHGWTVKSPLLAQFADFSHRGPNRRRLVWTSTSRGYRHSDPENLWPDGTTKLTAIGAPFAYLKELADKAGALPLRREGTLVLPMHGTALVQVFGDHEGYAKDVLDREGPSTVCLHIEDLEDRRVVRAWTAAGHSVVSAGERRDPRFLARILSMMSSATRVVSNRMATALLYAAHAGAEVAVEGPDFRLGSDPAADPGTRMRELWPEFYEPAPDQGVLAKIARDELGIGDMRSPFELKEILGWDRPSAGPYLDYWIGAPLEKTRAVLGMSKRPEGAHGGEAGLSPWHWLRHPAKHLPSPLPGLEDFRLPEPLRLTPAGAVE
ncbi:hypothetical protein [Arthrobacter sp. TMS1-12-1]